LIKEKRYGNFSIIVIVVFAITGFLYSFRLPAWIGSDEPFHYYYVDIIAREQRLPTAEETYESAHPPGYYSVAALVSLPFLDKEPETRDRLLRLFSVLMGMTTLFFLYLIGAKGLDSPALGMGLVVFAYANPAFVITQSLLGNDPAVVMAVTVTFYYMLKLTGEGGGPGRTALCGLLAGLSCLVKITASFLPVFFVVLYFFHPSVKQRGIKAMVMDLFVFAFVFAATCGWWYVRNYLMSSNAAFFDPKFVEERTLSMLPGEFPWFLKSVMLNFWLPSDYIRGFPREVPGLLKHIYLGLSAVAGALLASALFLVREKTPGRIKHIMNCFAFCMALFLLQQAFLNTKHKTAQARYMYPMICAAAAPVVFTVKRISDKYRLYDKLLVTAFIVSIIHHALWLFRLIVNIPVMNFNI